MATSTKKNPVKRSASKKIAASTSKKPLRTVRVRARGAWQRLATRHQNFMSRRPHRSLRRTRARDYVRSLKLPGYIAFTWYVYKQLRTHRWTFILLVMLYAVAIILLGGITSQDTYSQISSLLKSSSSEIFGTNTGVGFGELGQAGLLTLSTFLTGPQDLEVDQQILLFVALLFAWLTTVWLLREFLLGRNPKLRHGLYSAGAPVIATVVVVIVLIVQLLPLGLVALVYAALTSVGILDGGFGSMLFWIFAAMVAVLVLYWITSTLIALVIVTLPGMFPFRALRAAGDLVVSRRLRILLRLLWGVGVIAVMWGVVMIPSIILDTALKSAFAQFAAIPLVPYIGAFMASLTVVWISSYVYLLYRKVVDDDAKPA